MNGMTDEFPVFGMLTKTTGRETVICVLSYTAFGLCVLTSKRTSFHVSGGGSSQDTSHPVTAPTVVGVTAITVDSADCADLSDFTG